MPTFLSRLNSLISGGSPFRTVSSGSGEIAEIAGTGNPEGVITANPGSRYINYSNGSVWSKSTGTGNTGWLPVSEALSGYSRQRWFQQTTLVDQAPIVWNLDANQVTSVQLGGNRTVANPTNKRAGAVYTLIVKQDATGGRTLAFGTDFLWPDEIVPVVATAPNAITMFRFVSDGVNMFGKEVKNEEFVNPQSLRGLQLWLDGSDPSTLFDAESGGSLVAPNGQIARWEDKSNNGRHFTRSTAFPRPTRAVGVKNGRDAVAFANAYMTGQYVYTIGTLFMVWQQPTAVSGGFNFDGILSARKTGAVKVPNGSLGLTVGIKNTTPNLLIVAPLEPGKYTLNNVLRNNADLGTAAGVAVRTVPDRWQHLNVVLDAQVEGDKPIVLGADALTDGNGARLMVNGHIAEVIAYSDILPLDRVGLVTNYLVQKWGLA